MTYTKVTWYDGTGGTTATRVSAEHLNHLETQYDEVISQAAVWNNHDVRYYPKATAITTFFSTSFMGKGSSSDADLLDGHHGSEIYGTGLPVGSIVWWTKDSGDIPSGWHLCDGSAGTSDYRDRFVLGASATYTVKSLNGAATVTPTTYTVVIGETTIDATAMAAHTHGYTEYYHAPISASIGTMGYYHHEYSNSTSSVTSTSTGGGGSHNHTSGSSVTWSSEANLPPYYALYLIKKVS